MNKPHNTSLYLMRHGRTGFDYEKSTYEQYIGMLTNGSKTPLDFSNPGISKIPFLKKIDLICHSPYLRARQTAYLIRHKCQTRNIKELDFLREVRFNHDIISKTEYEKSNADERREIILTRWHSDKKLFLASIERARKLDKFINLNKNKNILIVTHGWFLRILDIYFIQNIRENIPLKNLLEVSPRELGTYLEVNRQVSPEIVPTTIPFTPKHTSPAGHSVDLHLVGASHQIAVREKNLAHT